MTDTQSPGSRAAAPAVGSKQDGRSAARERNRVAVVDALLDLYAEGKLKPDADEIARRSGVSRRSIFRYFDGFDDLGHAANLRALERYRHLAALPNIGEGTLVERIALVAAQRTALFEAARTAAIAMRLRAPFNAGLSSELAQNRSYFAHQVERQFAPELSAIAPALRVRTLAVADLLCGFEAHEHLRSTGNSSEEIEAAIRLGLAALFGAESC